MSSAGKRPERFPPRQAMATGDTLSTEEVSDGDSNNNEPAESSKNAWNRLSSVLGPRQEDVGGDQIERGEHKTQAKGTIHVEKGNREEDAEAGAIPLDGPPAEATEGHEHSPFSSSAFDRLPNPVPVVDVFFGLWWLVSALRMATRPVVICFSVFWLGTAGFDGFVLGIVAVVIVVIHMVRWGLLMAGRELIPFIRTPIPGNLQFIELLMCWMQEFWVSHRLGSLKLQRSLTSVVRSTLELQLY